MESIVIYSIVGSASQKIFKYAVKLIFLLQHNGTTEFDIEYFSGKKAAES